MRRMLLLVALVVPACGRDAPAPAPPPGAAPAAPAASGGAPACSLLSREDVQAVTGQAVTDMAPLNPSYPEVSCRIRFGTDSVDLNVVTGAPVQADAAAFTKWLNEETMGGGDWKAVTGLAVPAAELEPMIVALQKGDKRVQVMGLTLSFDVVRKLAERVAARM